MEFRNLGESGLRVSTVGLGCNNFEAAEWVRSVEDLAAVRVIVE
tara:strand:- start:156 stop:287 length:132 start_codon:yes stop_codon:yes gene_type:complete